MNINQRIKFFRINYSKNNKGKNYSQRQFAEKIGVSHGVINNIESEVVEAKDYVLKLICQTFNVNENWLRNGTEPIFIKNDEKSILEYLKESGVKPIVLEIIENYLKMTDKNKVIFDQFLQEILGNNENEAVSELSITEVEEYKKIKLY